MSLTEDLARLKEKAVSEASPEVLDLLQRSTEALVALNRPEKQLQVGDGAPDFALPNTEGKMVRLAELQKEGPVVVSFYRGSWCPFCMMEL
ncbi:MAG: redoxin domain-containing protein, partial [Acidobacteriota bacterium]